MSDPQKLETFVNRLHDGLYNSNGFTANECIKFMINNSITNDENEAIFILQLMIGQHVIITRNSQNNTFDPVTQSCRYYFNKHYKSTSNNSYWINFIPTFNNDHKRVINLQPSVPTMSPAMKYAKIYNKYAPKDTFGITPMDEYNKQLLHNVHPSNWKTPTPPPNGYNLVAIGAGAAGLVSVINASRLGAKCALIDHHLFGGDCLNTGCVPSKTLLKSAKILYDIKIKNKKHEFGVHINHNAVSVDFNMIMQRMRKVRAAISKHDAVERFSNEPYNIDCYLGSARFMDTNSIKVADTLIKFDKCVICTGAISNVPPIRGLFDINYLTSHSIWNLKQLPTKLGIIGCGPIGSEIAQCFQLFGCEVTMLDLMPRILNKEDANAAQIVYKSMKECGVKFVLNNRVNYVEKISGGIKISTTNGAEYIFSHLLIATGRKANVENMDLEFAHVKYDTLNGIEVNDFLQTTNTNIYAAGDCCNKFQFTHMVDAMAKIVVPNALFYAKKRVSSLIIPWVTYTFPQIAHVGLYESDLKDRQIEYDCYVSELENNGRAICDGSDVDQGFVKIFVAKGSDKIFGATIVSENAGDQISEVTLAMQGDIGLNTINKTIHPYPTINESIKYISDGFVVSKNEKLKALLAKILAQRLLKSKL